MSITDDAWAAWSNALTSLTLGAYLQALSLPLSMLVAWLTFKATSANQRYSLIVNDLIDQIKAFSECANKLSCEIEVHYLGDYDGGFSATAAKESRKRIMAQIKALDDRRSILDVFLSEREALALQASFDAWQASALGDSFPITRKDERCKDYDPPVVELRKAQSTFELYLANLRKKCIDHRTMFQRVIR